MSPYFFSANLGRLARFWRNRPSAAREVRFKSPSLSCQPMLRIGPDDAFVAVRYEAGAE